MRIRNTVVALFCLLVCTVAVLADTLTLKDGTVLQGKVQEVGDKYWIKLADGGTRMVGKNEVTKFEKGDGAVKPSTPVMPGGKTPPPAAAPTAPGKMSDKFASVKAKAERVATPVEALQLWDTFFETEPSATDVAAVKLEMTKWQKLQKDNAERINGKWIGGAERKKILKEVDQLVAQGYKDLQGANTVDGLAKFEKALQLYPNSFAANFELGYFYLKKGVVGANGRGNLNEIDKGIRALEAAQRILPKSPATLSNLAIGYNFRKRYVDSVMCAYQAAQIRESKDVIQNLVNAIAYAPPGLQQNNKKLKPILENAYLLAEKHGIGRGGSGTWPYIRPEAAGGDGEERSGDGGEEKGPPGVAWMGSGFFVTADGYILTNHHVATGDPKSPIRKDITFRIRMDDGTEKKAELIAVDDAADIAIMKIKPDKPVEFLLVADGNPEQGAKVMCLGYPTTGEDHPSLQISEGTVKSIHPDGPHHVWFDLNTTHGNSGGPVVDKSGHVIAILTAYHQLYNMVILDGCGPMQIKAFLDKTGDKAPKMEYVAPTPDAVFDGEKLVAETRKSTVCILAIRGDKVETADGDDKSEEKSPQGSDGGAAPEKPAG